MAVRTIDDWDDWGDLGGGGIGGKGGGSNIFNPDSLLVAETAKMMFAISEGPCQGLVDGLKSIRLDGTPLQNQDGTFNFKGVSVALVHGTRDQPMIPGFSDIETEHSAGGEIKTTVPQIITVNDLDTSAVRVKIALQSLQKMDRTTGNPVGATVQIAIDVQAAGGGYEPQTIYKNGVITGISTGPTARAYSIPLTGTGPWSIRVRRITADSTDAYLQDKTFLGSYTEVKDAKLTNPWTAKLAIALNAKQFSTVPKVTVEYFGRIVSVPTNYNTATRVYTGVWDGTFKQAWTDNPVWHVYDMATHGRYGAGRYLAAQGLDIWTLYEIAQFCDGLVDNGAGGTEPRFRFNAYLTKDEEAFKVLAHMMSVARSQLYYGGTPDMPSTTLTAIQDRDSAVKALFSPSNVIGGRFNYTGTPRKTRYTEVTVWWNDPAQAYKLVPVLVTAAPEYVARYGVQSFETTAFGATSKGQAIREGRRILYTNLLEQEMISFESGLEGVVACPGDLVQVQDPGRDRKRQGGRIVSATTSVITLDGQVTLNAGVAYTAWVTMPDGSILSRGITTAAGTVSAVTVSPVLPLAPQAEAQWQITPTATTPTRWRILGVKENKTEDAIAYEILAVANNPAKYALLDQCGTIAANPEGPSRAHLPVTGLTLSSSSAWGGGNALHTLIAKWTAPAGSTGAQAMAQFEGGAWERMTVSGDGATFGCSIAGEFKVRVIALYPRGASLPTEGTHTMAGIPTTTPAALTMTVSTTKPA